ncbi:MAG TPA: SUMF1/EgtB/PvdO family nonheme iron enzyme [Spirochaetota bacterium]|nr:SUMF1/EgtB/PvdO family nonheme iron enzyme [Spirochaetota bacterium]
MKKIIFLILVFIAVTFLYADEKKIQKRPLSVPEDAEWTLNNNEEYWEYRYKFQKPFLSWYKNGNLRLLYYKTMDKKYDIIEHYYSNGNLKDIIQIIDSEYLTKKHKKVDLGASPYAGKQKFFYENGKLKEEQCKTPVVEKNVLVSVLCGTEVFYDETGKEVKRVEHNVKCEYGCEEEPRQNAEQLIAGVKQYKEKIKIEGLMKSPVVGKIVSVDQSSKVVEVAYKPGFELSIGDQVCFIVDSEIVSFECKENANGTGSFVLKEDKNNKYSSVNKNSEPRFYKKNEVKYTDVLKSGPKPKAGDVKVIAGIEFVYIPEGECIQQPPFRTDEDAIGHVSPFWITRYEVTLGEFLKYSYEANRRLPANKGNKTFNSRYPADLGDYDEYARGFCSWFGKKHGVNTTLPLSKEWEFAARGGTSTDFYWGNDSPGDYCWYAGNSGGKSHPVGMKKPNAYGLYDMIGNLWEWCASSNLRGGAYFSEVRDLKYSVNNYLEVQRYDYYGRYDTVGTGFRMIIRVP